MTAHSPGLVHFAWGDIIKDFNQIILQNTKKKIADENYILHA
jgi:hypothetical protein